MAVVIILSHGFIEDIRSDIHGIGGHHLEQDAGTNSPGRIGIVQSHYGVIANIGIITGRTERRLPCRCKFVFPAHEMLLSILHNRQYRSNAFYIENKKKKPVIHVLYFPKIVTFLKSTSRSASILLAINQHPFRNTHRIGFLENNRDRWGFRFIYNILVPVWGWWFAGCLVLMSLQHSLLFVPFAPGCISLYCTIADGLLFLYAVLSMLLSSGQAR